MTTLTEQLHELAGLMVEAGSAPTPEELMRSLNSLVKQNGGKFKSAAQAKFMYRTLDTQYYRNSAPAPLAKQWAKGVNDVVVGLTARIEGFGKRTASKMRYYGFVYLLDGAGVVMRAKAKVAAGSGTGADSQFGGHIVSVDTPDFVRKGDASTLYDAHGEAKAAQARAQKQAPLIAKIMAVQSYSSNDFLQSLVGQLQTGQELTAGQERALARMMPYESTRSGSYQEKYEAGIKALERVVGFAQQAEMQINRDPSLPQEIKDAAKWYVGQATSGFAEWKKRPTYSAEIGGDASTLNNFLFDLGWRQKARRGWTLSLLWALGQVAKKGTKAGKNATQLSGEGIQFAEWLAGLTQQSVYANMVDYYKSEMRR